MGKVFIYNKVQALYYINEFKCKVIDFDVHRKTLKSFVVFDKEETSKAYDSWCKLCEEHKNDKFKKEYKLKENISYGKEKICGFNKHTEMGTRCSKRKT